MSVFNNRTKPLDPQLAEAIRKRVNYNPATGELTDENGSDMIRHPDGQPSRIHIRGRAFIARRVAVFLRDGEWPRDRITHRDGNPLNLRADNLEYHTALQTHTPRGEGHKYDVLRELVSEHMPHDHFKDEGIYSIRFDQRTQYVATVIHRLREAEHPHSNMADQYRLERTNFCLTAIGLKPAATLAGARARIDALI